MLKYDGFETDINIASSTNAMVNRNHVTATGSKSANEAFKTIAKNPHKSAVAEAYNIPFVRSFTIFACVISQNPVILESGSTVKCDPENKLQR